MLNPNLFVMMKSVFIWGWLSWKRDERGYRFGFASFKGVKDAAELEKEMRNIWLGNNRLNINVARFAMENEVGRDNKDQTGKKKGPFFMEQRDNVHTFKKQEGYNGS
ncbi:hypothetical protein Hanom_Chr11g01016931 [Helianthus anomalus]